MSQDMRNVEKLLPSNSKWALTDNNGIIVIVTSATRSGVRLSMMDWFANILKRVGKKTSIKKRDAESLANVLEEQANKLSGMAESYKLMAIALRASKDDFIEVIKTNPQISMRLDNPFE